MESPAGARRQSAPAQCPGAASLLPAANLGFRRPEPPEGCPGFLSELPDLLLSVDRPSLVGLLDPRLALNNLCHGEHLSTSCVLGLQVTTQGPPPDPLALEQNKEDSLLSQI